jgi:hypothetical protein
MIQNNAAFYRSAATVIVNRAESGGQIQSSKFGGIE